MMVYGRGFGAQFVVALSLFSPGTTAQKAWSGIGAAQLNEG
jgi:hypothetical protein